MTQQNKTYSNKDINKLIDISYANRGRKITMTKQNNKSENCENFDDGLTQVAPKGEFKAGKEIENLKIICDDREPESLKVYAETMEMGINLIRKRLETGDYICNDCKNVVVERKEINDFCSSIMDKRLENQIEKMKKKYKNIYVVIVGSIKSRIVDINEHCVLGMISSLLVKHKISVVMVDDDFQFLYLIKRIFERHLEEMKGGME